MSSIKNHSSTLSYINLSDNQECCEDHYSKPIKTNVSLRDKVKMAKKIGKGRARSMVIGAASIMNKWQDHLLFCWLTSIAFIIFVVGSFLIFSTFGRQSHSYLSENDRCLLRHTHALKTNSLTKNSMFLHVIVNNGEVFDHNKYKTMLTTAVKNHPAHTLNIYVLFNDLLHSDYKRNSRLKTWEAYHNGESKHNFFDTSSAERDEDMGVNHIKLQDNINIIQSTFSKYFKHSPLKHVWRTIPPDILPVVMRVLSVWEHGGTSLSWNLFFDKNYLKQNLQSSSRLKEMISELKRNLSTSVIKAKDPIEIKQTLIERLKYDLKGVPTDRNVYSSSMSTYKKVNYGLNLKKKTQFSSTSEYRDKKMKQYFKLTAHGLASDAKSSKPVSSSYYSDSYDSGLYDPSRSDGLPRSYESISREVRLRPQTSTEHTKYEMMRYINGNTKSNQGSARNGRNLLSTLYKNFKESSDYSDDSDSDDDVSQKESVESYSGNSDSDDDVSQEESVESYGSNNSNKKRRIQLKKIKNELQHSSTESYSSMYDSSPMSSSSESAENTPYMSLETLQKMFGPNSDEKHEPNLYIKENKEYKNNKAIQSMNIFTLPNKLHVTMDNLGYYISVRKPCNEFLYELISILQNTTDFYNTEEFLYNGLVHYCQTDDFIKCDGIMLL